LDTSLQGNDTNIIVATDKSEGIYWEVGLVGEITRTERFGHVFSFEGFSGGKERGNK
jgi:hypothetical protein